MEQCLCNRTSCVILLGLLFQMKTSAMIESRDGEQSTAAIRLTLENRDQLRIIAVVSGCVCVNLSSERRPIVLYACGTASVETLHIFRTWKRHWHIQM